jgi:hypothetical protein
MFEDYHAVVCVVLLSRIKSYKRFLKPVTTVFEVEEYDSKCLTNVGNSILDQWYSTYYVRVPQEVISLHLCAPKVVAV